MVTFYTCQSKSSMKTWLLVAVFFVCSFLIFSQNVFAQNEEIIVDTQDSEDIIYTDDFPELIDSFRSDVTINTNGTINVVETIQYDFKDLQKHGIYRNISLTKIVGSDRPLKITDVSVVDENGVPYTSDITAENPFNIRIGDADKTVSGKHVYKISYTGTNAIGYFDDRDEIYWNVTGNEWQVPIWDAEAHVYVPGEFTKEQLHIASYCGQFGAEDSCVEGGVIFDPIRNQTEVIFSTNPDVYYDPGGGMTVAVGFPKGIVAQPVLKWWEKDSTYYILAIISAGIFGLIFFKWFFGFYVPERKKRKRSIVTEYTPPDDLSPSQVSMIYNIHTSMPKAIAVDILYLASLGYISITQEDKPINSKFADRNITPIIYKYIKYAVVLIPVIVFLIIFLIFGKYGVIVAIVLAIIKRNDIKNWINSVFYPKEFILTPTKKLISENILSKHLKKLLDLVTNDDGTGKSMSKLEGGMHYLTFQSIKLSAQGFLNKMYPDVGKCSEASLALLTFSGAIFFSIFMTVFATFFMFFLQEVLVPEIPTTIFFVWGSIIVSVFLYLLIKKLLLVRLYRRTEIWYRVSGLRTYINIAEKDRLIFANDPEKSLEIYSTLLPYAMAFGLEKKWTKIFSGILITPPNWYHGSGDISLSNFSTSLAGFSFATAMTSNAGVPSSSSGGSGSSGSSSGSSGGGSSGGGGGGGGGGSW